jgi:hypothetical protein
MIKRQSVAFNLADPDQLRMFQHANERTNFSAYIKRLIQRDMENSEPKMIRKNEPEIVDEEDDASNFVSDFI